MSRKTTPRETEKPKKLTRAQKKEIDVLKGNALGECASVNAAHTVRVDGLIRDGGLCRAGLAVALVLAYHRVNFFSLGAGQLCFFGFFWDFFFGQWPLPPVPFDAAA